MTVSIENRPVVVGLSTSTYVEYFGTLPDGTEFVIHRPRDNWEYNQFQCLMKPPGCSHFTPVRILHVVRYRDGGTTDIKLDDGAFNFPTPFEPEKKPTFNGEEIVVHGRA